MSDVPSSPKHPLGRLYFIESLGSIASTMLLMGIYFYTNALFHWEMRRNLLLCCAQGLVYVFGALSTSGVASKIGRRSLLRGLQVILASLALVGFFFPSPKVMACVILIYTFFTAVQWPALESLVSSGATAEQLSRRIAIYNFNWSGTGAIALAITGTIVQHHPTGVFLVPMCIHVISFITLSTIIAPSYAGHASHAPEPELIPLRTLAMRLSRVALPATYAANYAIGAIMPSLPLVHQFPSEIGTLIASVWMMSRWMTFGLLGLSDWWHTRPRSLLIAAVLLLASFLGITLVSSMPLMLVSQIVMGASVGLIYASSLYFGMVLTEGSTQTGGYHEALIGLGSILGPGAGAVAQQIQPNSLSASVMAVSIVLSLSVIASACVSLTSRSNAPD